MFLLGVVSHVLAEFYASYGHKVVKCVVAAQVIVWKSGKLMVA